ncbi:hypothetical protein EYF80_043436 [Liparis tanakae]|uniref:Uncharacterized protein n=1 Tax=Liparis tanakae TaxID=230148 RepID=A0A4Z2FYH1_9TELE|nr:hypothetical protein EYF80_043436 [Liparis tanakae]
MRFWSLYPQESPRSHVNDLRHQYVGTMLWKEAKSRASHIPLRGHSMSATVWKRSKGRGKTSGSRSAWSCSSTTVRFTGSEESKRGSLSLTSVTTTLTATLERGSNFTFRFTRHVGEGASVYPNQRTKKVNPRQNFKSSPKVAQFHWKTADLATLGPPTQLHDIVDSKMSKLVPGEDGVCDGVPLTVHRLEK